MFGNTSRVGGKQEPMTRFFILAVLLISTACSTSKPAETPKPTPAARTAADLGPMCDRYYVHQRSCVNEYLRELVQVRAEYDMPKGMAAAVKDRGVDAVAADAKVEWERDTTLEKTAAICKAMAERTPPQHVDRLLADGDRCEAITECGAFAKCAVDTERTYIQSGMMH